MNYNLYDMIVPSECEKKVSAVLDRLMACKVDHYRALDEKQQAKLLTKSPNYLHEIGYSEKIPVDPWRTTTLQALCQELADEYGLRSREGKRVVVNDGAIVSQFAFRGAAWVKGVAKGKGHCAWVVVTEGSGHIFVRSERYIELRKGAVNIEGLLAKKPEKSNDSADVETTVRGSDGSDKLREELERMRKENAALKAERTLEERVQSDPRAVTIKSESVTLQ